MSAKQEILRRLQQVVSEQLGVQEEDITEASTWYELGSDSLDRLETTRVIENEFKVDIPHQVGERLNTVGETVDHLFTLMEAPGEVSNIRIEAVTTSQQWAEMSGIRTQVFTREYGFSFEALPGPGEAGVWHFLAWDDNEPVGTLSVVDTTGNRRLHQSYALNFGRNERVARYAQLAIVKAYRKRGIFELLIETAQKMVIRPNEFSVGWLLYPAAQARSSRLAQSFGFTAEAPLLQTEFGLCHVLMRRESSLPDVGWTQQSFPIVDQSRVSPAQQRVI